MSMKLNQILDVDGVNNAMLGMAEKIYAVGAPLAIIAVLKGGAYVAYELLKLLGTAFPAEDVDVIIGHIGLESYGEEMKSQGEVKLMTPLDLSRKDIRGRTVVIVDDCIETGNTFEEAKKIILGYKPIQLLTAVLVDKVAFRMTHGVQEPDIVGWTYMGDGFLVGCGMGMGEKYRGLPEICEVVENS